MKIKSKFQLNPFIPMFSIFDMLIEINSGVIFWLLPLDGLFMAISMYNLEHVSFPLFSNLSKTKRENLLSFNSFWPRSQSALNISDWAVVGYGVICIICASAWPFLYCYFATIASDRVLNVGKKTFDSNWYDFPQDLQKYIVLIISRSQKPIYFTGLGLVHCTLETLGKVSSTNHFILCQKCGKSFWNYFSIFLCRKLKF